jgi:hypothetical protein
MQYNQPAAQLSLPARVSVVVLIAGLAGAYVILSGSVTRKVEQVLGREWAGSHAALATLVRDGLAGELNRGSELGEAFESGGYREAVQLAGEYAGIALLAPDLTVASWSCAGAVPEISNLSGYLAVDMPSGNRRALAEFMRDSQLQGYQLQSPAGDRLPFNVVSATLPANGWNVLVFQDRQGAGAVAGEVRLSQTLAFLSLALLLVLLLLGFYISLAQALSTAVRSAAALEDAGRRFEERAGVMRGPLSAIQGLADMLVITEDPDERNNYLTEIKDEIRKLAAELQAYQGIFGR